MPSNTPNLNTPLPRRRVLQSLGLMGLGATLAACSAPEDIILDDQALGDQQDMRILNFALNLEYLEAAYYLAGIGHLEELNALVGYNSEIILPEQSTVAFSSDSIMEYATEIAVDELEHVKFLRDVLGRNRIRRPVLDLKNSFTTAARAAGVVGPNEEFNPFADEVSFLLGAFIFEDVGVTAYKGAASSLFDKDILAAAAGIMGVEAYHASAVRTTLYALDAANPDAGIASTVQKISDARDFLGSSNVDQGLVHDNPAHTPANIVPTDSNGLAFSRSTKQVMHIVYLNPETGVKKGGFFPEGLNGKVNQAINRRF